MGEKAVEWCRMSSESSQKLDFTKKVQNAVSSGALLPMKDATSCLFLNEVRSRFAKKIFGFEDFGGF